MDFNTFWHVFVWYFWVVYCNSNHDLALLGNLNIMDFSFMCIPTSSYPYGVFLYFLIWRNSILIFLIGKKTFFLEKKTRNNDWLYFVKNSAYFQFSMPQKWFIIWSRAIKPKMSSYISKSRIRIIYQKPIIILIKSWDAISVNSKIQNN